jgi:hypothetical protein
VYTSPLKSPLLRLKNLKDQESILLNPYPYYLPLVTLLHLKTKLPDNLLLFLRSVILST